MKVVIHLDSFFFVNAGMNLLILMIMRTLKVIHSTFIKTLFASAIGAIGAIFCFVSQIKNLHGAVGIYIGTCIIVGMIVTESYHYKLILKFLIQFYCIAIFIGGLFTLLQYHFSLGTYIKGILLGQNEKYRMTWERMFLVGSLIGCIFPAIHRIYVKMRESMTLQYPVEVYFRGKKIKGTGLLDTGNTLRDFFSNEPIAIVDYSWVKGIFSKEEQEQVESMLKMELVKSQTVDMKMHWVPYYSLGKNDGMLLCIGIENLVVGEKNQKQNKHSMIGIYPGKLSARGEYQVILHQDMVRRV